MEAGEKVEKEIDKRVYDSFTDDVGVATRTDGFL